MNVAVAGSGIVPYERFLRQLQRLGCLLSGVTVRHHHDHRFGLPLLDQVIEDLTSTSHIAPSILIATGSVEKVKHRVTFAGILRIIITIRGIDIHPTIQLQCGRVIPHLSQIAPLISLEIVGRELARNNHDAQIAHAITLLQDVQWVIHRHPIQDKIIGVKIRLRQIHRQFPHTLAVFRHVRGNRHIHLSVVVGHLFRRHESTGQLHRFSLRRY